MDVRASGGPLGIFPAAWSTYHRPLIIGGDAGGDVLFRLGDRFAAGLGARVGTGLTYLDNDPLAPVYGGRVSPAIVRLGRDENLTLAFTASATHFVEHTGIDAHSWLVWGLGLEVGYLFF